MDRSTAEMLASELIDELDVAPDKVRVLVAADFLEGLAWAIEIGDVEGWMDARLRLEFE